MDIKEQNGKNLELWLSTLTGMSVGFFCVISMMNKPDALPLKELAPIYISLILILICWMKTGFQASHLKEFAKHRGSLITISWQSIIGFTIFVGLHITDLITIKTAFTPMEYTLIRSLGVISGATGVHYFLSLIFNDLMDHFPEHHIKRFLDWPLIGWAFGFCLTQWYLLLKVVH